MCGRGGGASTTIRILLEGASCMGVDLLVRCAPSRLGREQGPTSYHLDPKP